MGSEPEGQNHLEIRRMPHLDPTMWRFLGEPSIPWQGKDLAPPLGRKSVALLAYLALAPEGAGRDEIAALLWPGPEPGRANRRGTACGNA